MVDLDLEKFFDRVDHDILMGMVAKRVADRRVLRLIRSFLTAGVLADGLVGPTDEGTPQGGPLSPLLSNRMLDVLDKELVRRGHRFVRYADDCNIYVRSHRAGERVMTSVARFVASRLKLRLNAAKSAVDQPSRRKFPVGFADIPPGDRAKPDGFSFTTGKAPARLRIAPQALFRFKARVRELTRRTKGVSLEQRIEGLRTYLTGWAGYFGFCQTPSVLRGLDRWIRRRLRAIDRRKRSIHACKADGQEAIAAPGSSGATEGTGSGSCSKGTCLAGSRRRPRPAPTALGGSQPVRLLTSPCPTRPSRRSAYPPWPPRTLNPANRRVRTRMHGGVGGVAPRGAPPIPIGGARVSRPARGGADRGGGRLGWPTPGSACGRPRTGSACWALSSPIERQEALDPCPEDPPSGNGGGRESRSNWREFLLGLKERGLPFAGSCPCPLGGADRASADVRWGRVRSRRRSCRDARGAARGPVRGSLPALLCGAVENLASAWFLPPALVVGRSGRTRCWVARNVGSRSCSSPARYAMFSPMITCLSASIACST